LAWLTKHKQGLVGPIVDPTLAGRCTPFWASREKNVTSTEQACRMRQIVERASDKIFNGACTWAKSTAGEREKNGPSELVVPNCQGAPTRGGGEIFQKKVLGLLIISIENKEFPVNSNCALYFTCRTRPLPKAIIPFVT
jgi:hypothetical protein